MFLTRVFVEIRSSLVNYFHFLLLAGQAIILLQTAKCDALLLKHGKQRKIRLHWCDDTTGGLTFLWFYLLIIDDDMVCQCVSVKWKFCTL